MRRNVVAAHLREPPAKWREANVNAIDLDNVRVRHGEAECRNTPDLSKADPDRRECFGRRHELVLRGNQDRFGCPGIARSPQ
jgi:hypothetical protein